MARRTSPLPASAPPPPLLAVDEIPPQPQVGWDGHCSPTALSTSNLPSVLFLPPHNHPAPSCDASLCSGEETEVWSEEGLP